MSIALYQDAVGGSLSVSRLREEGFDVTLIFKKM